MKGDIDLLYAQMIKGVRALPSAQPETHDKRTEMHARDLIDRQAAIDAAKELSAKEESYVDPFESFFKMLEHLPSAQQLSCDGCRHDGMWDDELEEGYDCPCARCIRNVRDNYEA